MLLMRVVGVLLMLIVAASAVTQLWSLHTQQLRQEQIEARLQQAEAAIAAGDVAQASRLLDELGDPDEANAARVQAVADRCERQERCADFLRKARVLRHRGAHIIDDSVRGDPIADGCTATLGIFRVRDNPTWTQALEGLYRAGEVRQEAIGLLTLLALRRLVAPGGVEAVRFETRDALECLRQAEQLGPMPTAAWAARRACYRRLGDNTEADLLRRDCAAPESAEDYYTIGFLAEHVRVEEMSAADAYRQALVLDPGHYGAHVGRFSVARRQGDLQTQVLELTACLALHPDEPSLFLHRALARYRLQEYPGALEDWNVGLRLRPDDAAGHYWRGRVYFLAGRWREADADFSAAMATTIRHEGSPLAWRALARARLGRHREAADDAEKALELRRDAETAWFAARTYSLCVRAIANVEPREREELTKRYGARSVTLLKEAIARGLARDPGQREGLRASPDLDPVRGRRDFADVLRGVEERE
jgi:tetratricopeptide (TPR) repeat protein